MNNCNWRKIVLCLVIAVGLIGLCWYSNKLNPDIHSFDVTGTTLLNILTVGGLVVYLNHTHNERIHKICVLCETIDKIQCDYIKVRDIMITANNNDKQVRNAVCILKSAYVLERSLFQSITEINSSTAVKTNIDKIQTKHQDLREYVDIPSTTMETTNNYNDIAFNNCVNEIVNGLMIIKFNL